MFIFEDNLGFSRTIFYNFRRIASAVKAKPLCLPFITADGGPQTMADAVQQLFGVVLIARDTDDRLLSYAFRVLPSQEVRKKNVDIFF